MPTTAKAAKAYVFSVGLILAVTSAAKLYSATGTAKILDVPEGLLPMSVRQALWLVGCIEAAIALLVLIGRNPSIKLVLVAWLGANFVLYRLATVLLTVGKPCPCLGSITEKLPLRPETVDRILGGVVLYLFLGSCLFLMGLRKQAESAGAAGTAETESHPSTFAGTICPGLGSPRK